MPDLNGTSASRGRQGGSGPAPEALATSPEPEFDIDLFVIGGGSGGVRVAHLMSGHDAKVILAEEHGLRWTCVIFGCEPKKLFVYPS
jgi:glutathione reductase (NADPH)